MSTTALFRNRSRARFVGFVEQARFVGEVLKDAGTSFSDNEGYRLGAAFSYYATFSIFPLVLLAVTVVGFVVGDSAPARDRLLDALTPSGSPVHDLLEHTLSAMQAAQSVRGISAVVGLATLLFAASGAFVELYGALNRIWGCPPKKYATVLGTVRGYVMERLTGFGIVACLGLTLLVSLGVSSVLAFVVAHVSEHVETPLWPALARTANVLVSIALLSALVTAAFHFIPRSRPPVRVVVGGAILTAALFSVLKELFTTYLSHLTSYSAYGIAGGVLALTTWIYLSSQIFFFGAQLTRVYAARLENTA
jgi:membrane protein